MTAASGVMGLLLVATSIVSGIFTRAILGRYRKGRRPHHLAWSVALSMFCLASLAASAGILTRWTSFLFRSYYLLGAVVNVPMLALGTISALVPRRFLAPAALGVSMACAYATAVVFSADLNVEALVRERGLPDAGVIVPDALRLLSRIYSFCGFAVVVAGALWSGRRFLRAQSETSTRFAQANFLVALGVTIVAVGSIFARQGEGIVFSLSLLTGVSIMYSGFSRTGATAKD